LPGKFSAPIGRTGRSEGLQVNPRETALLILKTRPSQLGLTVRLREPCGVFKIEHTAVNCGNRMRCLLFLIPMVNSSASSRRKRSHNIPAGFARRRRDPQRKPSKQSSLESAWRQNWTLLVGLFSVGFISARLLAAASDDPETAYAILQATGTGSVVVGSLIPAIGLLVFPLLVAGVSHGFSRERLADKSQTALMLAIGALAGVITIFTAPAAPLLFAIVFTSFTVILSAFSPISTWKQRRRNLKSLIPSPYVLVTVYSVVAIVSTALSSTLWLPSENIIMRGRPGFSAYILAQNDQTTTILTQNPTAVIEIPSSQIVLTQICKTPDYRSQEETIVEWLGTSSVGFYPKCDGNYFEVKSK
jgi:hypothetical protein